MNIKEIINGIAVIIDDEVDKQDSGIYKIRENIIANNIPVATYSDVPSTETVKFLSQAAFVILDWNFYQDDDLLDDPTERLMLPGLKENKKAQVIEFVKALLNEIFIPIFIFTTSPPELVMQSLKEEHVICEGNPDRIFVKQKNDIKSDEELFDTMDEWLKTMPSVYVLKEWEKLANATKTKMFLEWYELSPNWVSVIWKMIKNDSIENDYEFGTFITKNIVNRMQLFEFDEEYIQGEKSIPKSELLRIIEGERYQKYDSQPNQPKQAYTGDLFKCSGKYYLNLRAQCDISREEDGEYNPDLYCIKGSKLRDADIIAEDIKLTDSGDLVFSNSKNFSLEDLGQICQDEDRLLDFNANFKKYRNNMIFYNKGELLEKKTEAIIACVDNGKYIKFELRKLELKKFYEIKEKRIGRILPPYITKIQQKFAQHIVREGIMPIPEELFLE
uniref:hypothetical protein n=1 Tax=Enterocloster clostridioformis TaxID=1531 RepID=UPI0025A5B0AF|nr:hypothetical protein [Enterocloster clostridioformis]